jgi:hypothetical protein
MSEVGRSNRKSRLFWQVSTIVLLAAVPAAALAAPSEGGLWVELGGQYTFDNSGDTQDIGAFGVTPNIHPGDGYSVNGKITWKPEGSAFSYALGVKYGRTRSRGITGSYYSSTGEGSYYSAKGEEHTKRTHTIVDFEVGKDVGVGMFGHNATTTVGVGLRYAHLNTTTRGSFTTASKYQTGSGTFGTKRTSDLVGPRLFFKVEAPVGSTGFTVSAGAGGGVLYGRNKIQSDLDRTINSHETDFAIEAVGGSHYAFSRSKNRFSPTADGFAQLNWKLPSAPLTVSAGYKFDGVFNGMDGGYSSAHQINVIDSGPYLSMVFKLH